MITIGTDCSGIEAPIEALKQLGIQFEHKWACEIDKFARQSILANYHPEIIYKDITKRDHSTLPDVDIYVCGFPCQSFSLMGKKRGTKDKRSNIMLHCIDVIKQKTPLIFILENVKNFKYIEGGTPYNHLLTELSSIKNEDGSHTYNLYPDIYNTKDYGIPQNRERIYIIGIQKDIQLDNFVKPHVLPLQPIEDYLLDKTINQCTAKSKVLLDKLSKSNLENVILTPFTFCSPPKSICPTLTTQCARFYWSKYKRTLDYKECLLLQGFQTSFIKVVSDHQMFRQIGNSMSVNVLKAILRELFTITLLHHL